MARVIQKINKKEENPSAENFNENEEVLTANLVEDASEVVNPVTPNEEADVANIETDVKTSEVPEVPETKEVIGEEVKEEPQEEMYQIVLNRRLDSYIGDAWYHLDSGVEYLVPKNIKDILLGAGYLVAR